MTRPLIPSAASPWSFEAESARMRRDVERGSALLRDAILAARAGRLSGVAAIASVQGQANV